MKNPRQIHNWDKKYVWHPFTQMQEYAKEDNLIIKSGKGIILKDVNNHSFIDGVSSLWVNVHGHRKKELDNAIKNQLKKIAHSTLLGIGNVPSVELAKKLIEISPEGLKKVFYSDSGATGVEIGLKMAFQYWQQKPQKYAKKTKFISLENAYHGDTIGAVSVGKIGVFHNIFSPLLFKAYRAPSYYCYRCEWNKEKISVEERFEDSSVFFTKRGKCNWECIEKLGNIAKKYNKEICAFIVEPLVQGAGGIVVAPEGYLKKAWEICKKYNILFIADEVAVGLGRTGKMFACNHEKITPDILVLAKSITGGYLPLAATLTTLDIYNAFLGNYKDFKTFFHGHTYTGNPLACAVSLANLKIYKKERVLEKLQDKIKFIREKLRKFCDLKYVGDIRQCGFVIGIELVKNKISKQPFPLNEKIGIKICNQLRKEGILLRPLGSVIVVIPPFSISNTDMGKMLNKIYEVIKNLH